MGQWDDTEVDVLMHRSDDLSSVPGHHREMTPKAVLWPHVCAVVHVCLHPRECAHENNSNKKKAFGNGIWSSVHLQTKPGSNSADVLIKEDGRGRMETVSPISWLPMPQQCAEQSNAMPFGWNALFQGLSSSFLSFMIAQITVNNQLCCLIYAGWEWVFCS